MAHPMSKSSKEGHNAKLRRMTENYGSASGPKNNILAPTNRGKGEGPSEAVGFGSDDGAPRDRADKPGRVSNPVATYKKGGAVKRAEGGDVSPITQANRNQAESSVNRARGGRARKGGKGKTNVNVIIAPQGGGAGAPPMAPPIMPPIAAGPPRPPMGPPPGAPPMGAKPPMGMPPGAAGLPMAPGAPGGTPPGIMPPRASGGRVEETLKEEGLTRRARGGKVHMTAGAATGVGRLEKIGEKPHDAGRPQAV